MQAFQRISITRLPCVNEQDKLQGRNWKEKGNIDYRYFKDFTFQPDYALYKVLTTVPEFKSGKQYVSVRVPIPAGGAVARQNEIVTGYRFALIMIVGDPFAERELDTYDVGSEIYKMDAGYEEGCELKLKRPTAGEPWMCCLRIVTYEKDEVAYSSRHSEMKVVGWSAGGGATGNSPDGV